MTAPEWPRRLTIARMLFASKTKFLNGGPMRVVAWAVLAAAATSACAPAARISSSPHTPTAESRVYDARAGRHITMRALTDRLAAADVVFFGEQHDDPATHRAELAYLAAVGARRDNVVVSLEMFERDVQSVVDAYMAGQVTDSVLMKTARPWPNYVTDYRPLVELARANGWPVIASNVPRRLASMVGRGGLAAVDTLSASERSLVARELICPRDAYYQRFAQEMSGHGPGGMSATDSLAATAMTNRFYEAQCVKDETMAESIVAALDRAGHGAILVHFNGAFHSNLGLGTAERVRRRRPAARIVVVTAVPVDDVATADARAFAELGDYILITPRPPQPKR